MKIYWLDKVVELAILFSLQQYIIEGSNYRNHFDIWDFLERRFITMGYDIAWDLNVFFCDIWFIFEQYECVGCRLCG